VNKKWSNKTYCVLGSNCQTYADALRQEYYRLEKTQKKAGK